MEDRTRAHPAGPGTGRAAGGAAAGPGFSYVEVLVAMVVLAVGILGATIALNAGAVDVSHGGRETAIAQQAQAILERMRSAVTYEDFLSYADDPPPGAARPRPGQVEEDRARWLAGLRSAAAGGPDAGGSIAVTQQGAPPHRMATVTVSVDWPGRRGPRPPTFVTQVAEWP